MQIKNWYWSNNLSHYDMLYLHFHFSIILSRLLAVDFPSLTLAFPSQGIIWIDVKALCALVEFNDAEWELI